MTSPLTLQDRSAFYRAAVLSLHALDARERTARRFGADADARWTQFAGALGAGDRINILLRDAAGTWGAAFHQLPVPKLEDLRDKLLDLVVAVEETVQKLREQSPEPVVATTLVATPKLAALREARTKVLAERAHLRRILVSLQEEMDWRVYGRFGLPTVEAPSIDAVRVIVEPNQRPFEVRLAREVATDISASELFRVHKRAAPKDVGGPLADLYRQRLRLLDEPEHGKQLRLLETPETKRRWSLADDTKAFADAARTWLLERIEATFREQTTPELRTARQLALGRDPAVAAAHELLTEESGLDLVKLISDLVDGQGVPFLAGYRYAETGMEKRASWEETWRLQRLEDEGKLTWTPPAPKRTNVDPNEVLAALKAWKPEVDEEDGDDEEAEVPEGPTEVDLATDVGVTKALIKKALKKLEADGLVEKLSGRPARYLATGDQA